MSKTVLKQSDIEAIAEGRYTFLDIVDAIVTTQELAEEVLRLRKLAPWHDRPRVRIKNVGEDSGREGHLIASASKSALVILDGSVDQVVYFIDSIEYITPETSA